MKLVVVRFRTAVSDWYVSEKDEKMSALLDQPVPDTSAGGLLTSWPTRQEACAYAAAVARLEPWLGEKTKAEIRERARAIVRHG